MIGGVELPDNREGQEYLAGRVPKDLFKKFLRWGEAQDFVKKNGKVAQTATLERAVEIATAVPPATALALHGIATAEGVTLAEVVARTIKAGVTAGRRKASTGSGTAGLKRLEGKVDQLAEKVDQVLEKVGE